MLLQHWQPVLKVENAALRELSFRSHLHEYISNHLNYCISLSPQIIMHPHGLILINCPQFYSINMCTNPLKSHTHNHFMALLDSVWDYPGEPAPEQ